MPRPKFYNPAKHKPLEKSIEAAIGVLVVEVHQPEQPLGA